ncbi:MAG: LysR family transcriptional regulator [Bacilli bacterium]|nr:LysR family transcriptional regulator [Bacilli bacterium]
MNNNINLNLYKVFYFVATTKSFKQASIDLCVSQPAISTQIKNLENLLNVKLFYRYSKGIELTNEAKILLSHIEKMNFYLEAAEKYIKLSKDMEIGKLTIGCPSHITSFYLLKYIEDFRKKYPNIEIKVFNDSTNVLIDYLSHHKIDFIVDSSPIEIDSSDMNIEQIAEFDTVLIANKDYNDEFNVINNSNNKELILPLPRSSMRKNLEKLLLDNNIKYKCGLSVDTTDLIISAVKRNLGLGYVVKESVKEELNDGTLVAIDAGIELPKLYINLVYNKEYLSFPAEKFLNNIKEH